SYWSPEGILEQPDVGAKELSPFEQPQPPTEVLHEVGIRLAMRPDEPHVARAPKVEQPAHRCQIARRTGDQVDPSVRPLTTKIVVEILFAPREPDDQRVSVGRVMRDDPPNGLAKLLVLRSGVILHARQQVSQAQSHEEDRQGRLADRAR